MIDASRRTDDRGQSPTVGFAMLIGLTLIGVTAVLLFGGMALADLKATAQVERAESAMTQFDARASRVALGPSSSQTVGVASGVEGQRLGASATGRFVVRTEAGTEFVNQTMGTIEYRTDGGVVAFQGGGVWRGTGESATMVSPPEFHYNDGTVTVPLVVVEPRSGGPSGGSLAVSDGARDLRLGPGQVQNTQVTVEIHSEYYAGWGRYFRDRIPGVSVRTFDANRTVLIDLGHLTIDGDYTTGLVSSGDVEIGNGGTSVESRIHASDGVDGDGVSCDAGSGSDCYTTGPVRLSDLGGIRELVADAEGRATEVELNGSDTTLDAGAYYTNSTYLDGDSVTMDLADGNVTLYVDGYVAMTNSQVRVKNGANTNHYAKVFVTGDFAMAQGQSGVGVESNNATRFQMFGTPEMHFAIGQSHGGGDEAFVGTVYAPRDDPATGDNRAAERLPGNSASHPSCEDDAVCIAAGNKEVRGAIVAGSMQFSQSSSFDYAEELRHVQPSLPPDADLPPDLTYLHVSVNEVTVRGAPVSGPGVGVEPAEPPAPSVDAVEVTDRSTCSGNGCEESDGATFDVSWDVSDPEGDLASVTVEVRKEGNVVETYSGSDGSRTFSDSGGYGEGAYAIRIVAEDVAGHRTCRTVLDPVANGGNTDHVRSAC